MNFCGESDLEPGCIRKFSGDTYINADIPDKSTIIVENGSLEVSGRIGASCRIIARNTLKAGVVFRGSSVYAGSINVQAAETNTLLVSSCGDVFVNAYLGEMARLHSSRDARVGGYISPDAEIHFVRNNLTPGRGRAGQVGKVIVPQEYIHMLKPVTEYEPEFGDDFEPAPRRKTEFGCSIVYYDDVNQYQIPGRLLKNDPGRKPQLIDVMADIGCTGNTSIEYGDYLVRVTLQDQNPEHRAAVDALLRSYVEQFPERERAKV